MTEQINEPIVNTEQVQAEVQYRPDVKITSEKLSDEDIFGDDVQDNVEDGSDEVIDDEQPSDEASAETVEQKPKNKVQARIDEITREKREAQEEARQLKAENEALKQASIKQEPILEEPDLLNYDDTEEYKADLKKFYKQQADIQVKQELQIKPKVDNYNSTLAKVREANPSFQANLNALNDTDAPSDDNTLATVNKALIESEHGAFLLNEIVKDKAKAVELFKYAKNDPAKFYREIGKIENTLSLQKSKATLGLGNKTQPKPIDPVRSNGGAEKSIANMTSEEYASYRRKQGSRVF